MSRIEMFCMELRARPEDGEILLVIASEVSEGLKQDCWKRFHIHIWDTKNLLWLFSEFDEIRSEFVALSDYAIGDISPVPPEFVPCFNTLEEIPKASEEDPATSETISEPSAGTACEEGESAHTEAANWEERLSRIEPGQDHSREYERFCVDFLRRILTDYFSLWEEQDQTNDGLHRFDLCCKIISEYIPCNAEAAFNPVFPVFPHGCFRKFCGSPAAFLPAESFKSVFPVLL